MPETPAHRRQQRPLSWKYELDWDNDGFGPNDDITPHVMTSTFRSTLGNGHVASVGKATIVLGNEQRLFTPTNRMGRYYGKMLPRLPIRVTVNDGQPRTLFVGYTETWTASNVAHGQQTATLECSDLLGVLQTHSVSIPVRENERSDVLLRHVINDALRAPVAQSTFSFTGQPSNNDTISVDGYTFKFKTSLSVTPTENEVLIGATYYATIDNTLAALNGGAGEGTTYKCPVGRSANVAATPTPSYYHEVRSDSPVRWYRMGEPSGTTATDVGSNASNGTYNGVTLAATGAVTGDTDTAASFDGVNDYTTLPTLDMYSRPLSIEMWFKPDASPPTYQFPFVAWYGAGYGAAGEDSEITFLIYDDAHIRFGYWDTAGGGITGYLHSAAGSLTWGAWHHAVGVYEGATGLTKLYLNGVLVDTDSIGAYVFPSPSILLGRYIDGSSSLKGDLDEVAIYWDALTPERIAAHYAAASVTPGIVVRSKVRGSAGNGLVMSESASNITVSGNTAGGSDLPTDASIETGLDTFDVVGDSWDSERTNVMSCIQDICESERSFFWVNRSGQPVYKNRGWLFRQTVAAPKVTLVGEPKLAPAVDFAEVYTSVKVSVTPRSILTSGVVAKADTRITVNGTGKKNEDGSWTRFSTLDDPKVGVTTLTLQFVDTGTGKISGAKNLVIPLVPYDDYTAWDFPDGTGFDYTDNGVLTFGVIPKTTGVELDVHNSALGPLYLFDLQVQGQAIVAYDAVTKEARDADAVALYGTRVLSLSLPLASSEILADAVAHYTLSRYKDPMPRISQFKMGNRRESDWGFSMFSVEIGDVVYLTDEVLGITAGKYLIVGHDTSCDPGGVVSTTFDVMQLDDVTYAILDDAIYGILDVSARLSI